jgi:predicted nuclease of predicted toxin-antitoxin system
MALAFYVDEHVPKPITNGLRIRSIDVLTVQEDGRAKADDLVVLDRAAELDHLLLSFDADMLREVTRRQQQGIPFATLIFAHPSRVSVGECIQDLEMIAQAGDRHDLLNQVIYLPL